VPKRSTEREAAALRENLLKRKAQQRERRAGEDDTPQTNQPAEQQQPAESVVPSDPQD